VTTLSLFGFETESLNCSSLSSGDFRFAVYFFDGLVDVSALLGFEKVLY